MPTVGRGSQGQIIVRNGESADRSEGGRRRALEGNQLMPGRPGRPLRLGQFNQRRIGRACAIGARNLGNQSSHPILLDIVARFAAGPKRHGMVRDERRRLPAGDHWHSGIFRFDEQGISGRADMEDDRCLAGEAKTHGNCRVERRQILVNNRIELLASFEALVQVADDNKTTSSRGG